MNPYAIVKEDAVGKQEKRVRSCLDDGSEGLVELFGRRYAEELQIDPQRLRPCVRLLQRDGMEEVRWIPKQGHAGHLGSDLPEELQSLALQIWRDRAQARDVATRPRQARDDAASDRIADRHHDERHRCGRLLHGKGRRCTGRDDEIHVCGQEIIDEARKPLVVPIRPSVLDQDVAALLIAELTQPVAEGADEICFEHSRGVSQEADLGHLWAVLCAQRQRPRTRRAAEHAKKFAAPHRSNSLGSLIARI